MAERCIPPLSAASGPIALLFLPTIFLPCCRDIARKYKPHITKPEILAPLSIHPAFEKAAEYFGLEVVHTDLNSAYEGDVQKLEQVNKKNV